MNEVVIDTIDKLIFDLNSFPNNFFFRGQSNADWDLTSSLERVIGEKWNSEKDFKFEDFSLYEFQSKFHLYDGENIMPSSKLAWLSIMQHYGVPTRLVDFTTSPYVALYFALETCSFRLDTDLSIFAIDYGALMQSSVDYVSSRDRTFKYTPQELVLSQDEVYRDKIDPYSYEIAWVAEPKELNARLDRQSGSFLLSVNRDIKISDILDRNIYSNVTMVKFRISKKLHQSIFAMLRKMNITSKSLYGNLDGLARSINMAMKVYAS